MDLKKGYFITFEGVDGCGKTTQIELLKEYLDKNNIKNIVTREPGATQLGLELRKILLHYKEPVAHAAEAFLYLADRAQHVQTKIKPSLSEKKIVLCDRYIDSSVAYQGYGREADIEQINFLNSIATSNLKPDLTLVYDIDSTTAQERVGKTKDRMESQGLEFYKKVRLGYLELAKNEPSRIKVIDSNQSIENVFLQTKKNIEEFLNL